MHTTMTPIASQTHTRSLTLASTLALHLAPGIAITLAFFVLAGLTVPLGWAPSLALLVTWLLIGLPVLLGLLLVAGRQRNGTWSLTGVLLYRESLPRRDYAWLVPLLLVWAALASTLFFPVGEAIRLNLFAGWPAWLNLSALAQNPARYPKAMLWTIVFLSAVLNIAVPIVEEMYFRSFLLPRLPLSRRWSPLWSSVLFSLYHFWLPWDIIGRIIALLPVVYAVQSKRNVYLSIWVHVLLNLIGTIGLAVVVMSNSGS